MEASYIESRSSQSQVLLPIYDEQIRKYEK
jgi:hypothetical protein